MFGWVFMISEEFEDFIEFLEQECLKGSGEEPLTKDELLNVIRRMRQLWNM